MQISIHDYANNRVINARVPDYLADADAPSDEIAVAVITTLGLNLDETEYMIGEFETVLADHNADSSRDARGIELLTQDFKADALQTLKDNAE